MSSKTIRSEISTTAWKAVTVYVPDNIETILAVDGKYLVRLCHCVPHMISAAVLVPDALEKGSYDGDCALEHAAGLFDALLQSVAVQAPSRRDYGSRPDH